MSRLAKEIDWHLEIDGIPCVENIRFDQFNINMSIKADENYIYLPMFDRLGNGTSMWYLMVDKRLFQIGEVQE